MRLGASSPVFPPAVVTFADVRLTPARFLAIALEFQLGADILSTAVAPTWDAIGKLAAVAVIRTALKAAARAYRAARRLGARQHEWHWAAVREVIRRHPEMTHREADGFAQSIIRYVSLYYGKWFWN